MCMSHVAVDPNEHPNKDKDSNKGSQGGRDLMRQQRKYDKNRQDSTANDLCESSLNYGK